MMRIPRLTVIVLLVVVTCGANAGGQQTAALIDEATLLYENLDLDSALVRLKKAFEQPNNSRMQIIRILYMRGLCLATQGDYKLASEAYIELLAMDPSFRIGSDVAPRIRAPFENLLKQGPPSIGVQVHPPQASEPGKPLIIRVRVGSNPANIVRSVVVWLRRGKSGTFIPYRLQIKDTGEFPVYVPEQVWRGDTGGNKVSMFWYATVLNRYDGHIRSIGSSEQPLIISPAKPKPHSPLVVGKEAPWYQKWWVWTIVGGVAMAGAATGLALGLSERDPADVRFTVRTSIAE